MHIILFFKADIFSYAIFSTVSPKICSWSLDILVHTRILDWQHVTLSNLPPNPVSSIATSTFCSLKYQAAIAVIASKKDEFILLIFG